MILSIFDFRILYYINLIKNKKKINVEHEFSTFIFLSNGM